MCEGYTDVMALHEAGFARAVAALGTSFSIDHVRTLARFAKRIVCMFDGDAAGQRAAERAVQFIDKSEADLRCVVLPDGQDPAEFLDTHRSSDLQKILQEAEPLMDFVLRKRLENVGPTAPGGVRMAALDEIAGILAPLRSSVLLDEYALVVGDWLGIGVDEVKKAIRSKPIPRDNNSYGGTNGGTYGNRSASQRGNGAYGNRNASQRTPQVQGNADYPYSADMGSTYVPDDYVPLEAYEGTPIDNGNSSSAYSNADVPAPTVALTSDERLQLQAEQELLSLMAANPDALRAHANRISTFLWVDERHETIAWAMLATPEGTPPADVVKAASALVPEAPRILSSGSVVAAEGVDDEAKVSFVLDTVELYSTRRKIQELRLRIRSGASTSENVFVEATDLQRHANELANRVASGFNNR